MPEAVRAPLGRDEPLAELARVLAAVAAGRGGLVVVSGEAGIGKTSLVRELAERAGRDGFGVAWAACFEEGAGPAYWPWIRLCGQIAEAEPGLPAAVEAAARLAGGASPVGGGEGELARFALFDAVHRGLRAAANRRPWLLVLDDLQWADGSSLSLLALLARQLAVEPVVVLATVRDDPGQRSSRLDGLPAGHRLALGGLDPATLARIVGLEDGEPVASLHRRTRGNPLFATELARLARSTGVPLSEVQVPASVLVVLARRLEPLSGPARQVLRTAAALGTEFAVDWLAAVDDDVIAALDEAAAAGLVTELATGSGQRRWAFRHALVRDVLYAELGVADRVRRHERIADALVGLSAAGAAVDPAALAHHFTEAAPAGRAADALLHTIAAARAAEQVAGYAVAAGHYRDALGLLDLASAAADRGELLIALAESELAAGRPDQARTGWRAAVELARRDRRADVLAAAALGLSGGRSGFEVPGGDPELLALLAEARAVVAAGSPDWVRLTARRAVALPRDTPGEDRKALAAEAVAVARRLGEPMVLAAALAARCDTMAGPDGVEPRQAAAEEIVALAAAAGDVRAELLGRRLRLVALLERGDYLAADVEIADFARRVERIRQPLYAWYAPLWRAMRAVMVGDLDLARRELAEAEDAGRVAGSANATMLVTSLRWWLLIEDGELAEQQARMRAAAGHFPPDTDMLVSVALSDALAGDLEAARGRIDRVGTAAMAALIDESEWLPMLAQLADTVFLLGGHDVARWAYDALRPHRTRHAVDGIGAYCHGSVERHLGKLAAVLGRPDAAREHFAAALAANRAAGAALLVAGTERDARRALRGEPGLRAADSTPGARFRRDGELWSLSWAGRTVSVKDTKGVRDIARLLAAPGAEVAALDLAGVAVEVRDGDLGEVVDAAARTAYRARLADLDAELAEADEQGDTGRSERAADEREVLLTQLTAAYGLGGRTRRAGDPAERARSAVTWRIRDAVRRIEAVHPALGRHLRHSVRTGRFCCYRPEQPVDWQLS